MPSLARSLPLLRRSPSRFAHGAAACVQRWRPWRRLSRAAALAEAWRSAAASAAAARSRCARCVVLNSSSSLRVVVSAVASDVGRPGAVDGEGYIHPVLGARAAAVGGGNSSRRSSRARDGASALGARRRQPQARHHQPSHGSGASRSFAAAFDVGRPGAVDGKGYIPSSALELPPWAAATVADVAAVLATAPARLTRATASRKHDTISRRTMEVLESSISLCVFGGAFGGGGRCAARTAPLIAAPR